MKKKIIMSLLLLMFLTLAGKAWGTEVMGVINTIYGYNAGNTLTADNDYVTFFGAGAGYQNGDYAFNNTYIGYEAGYLNSTGDNNTCIGYSAGFTNSDGSNNTIIGYFAGAQSRAGANSNTFVGASVGSSSDGSYNTFMGEYAGYKCDGSYNTYIGYQAGYEGTDGNTTAVNNTFVGSNAGYYNNTGSNNTFIGMKSGTRNTTGYGNNFVGVNAGFYNTTGYRNTFQGNNAGRNNTTGYGNTFIGTSAGYTNTTGNSNVFIGYNAGYNETGSNKLYIDNSNTATPLIYGDFAADTVTINGTLTGELVDISSREYKDNIQELKAADAMATLQGLHPVTFNFKRSPQEQKVGFIAEDVPGLVATNDRKGLSSMDVVAVLTKVVQEQQEIISAHSKKITELEQLLSSK